MNHTLNATINTTINRVVKVFPRSWRDRSELISLNFFLKTFTKLNIPLVSWVRARIIELDEEGAVLRIPLTYRTKNHLKSIYFGVLMTGADVVAGVMTMYSIRQSGKNVSMVFRDCYGEFHKRADGHVHFTCMDRKAIEDAIEETISSKDRVNLPLTVNATVPEKHGNTVVASFRMTLSIKCHD